MSKPIETIEQWAIDDIKPYEKNAKVHHPEQIAALAASIKERSWTALIVVDKDGVIIAGHGRRLAAIALGLKKVPVIVRRDLSKADADALRLADNRMSSTVYDTDMLQKELTRLASEDIDLGSMGFDPKELEFLTADLGAFDSDAFVDDITEAVAEQKTANEAKAKEVDETVAPIGDAFGFKRLTVAQSRRVRAFMNQIEAETKKSGIDALMTFLDQMGVA